MDFSPVIGESRPDWAHYRRIALLLSIRFDEGVKKSKNLLSLSTTPWGMNFKSVP
jgi:hypothetical protein